jgi:methylthioribose-1-phosphate isomerase
MGGTALRKKLLAVEWVGGLDGCLRIIDQTTLPGEVRIMECRTPEQVFEAIRRLQVRGAPAIGIAGAMGAVLGIRNLARAPRLGSGRPEHGRMGAGSQEIIAELKRVTARLATARPTAVNLSWALDRMVRVAEENSSLDAAALKQRLLDEAKRIRDEDAAMCRAIGEHGAALFRNGDGVLTHCNAGALATAEYGTALSAVFVAHEMGKRLHVFVDETRPLLQGARLTAWELSQAGVEMTLICDNMAAQVMCEGRVQRVIVGADRIAANGDTANKIGTYSVAVLAHAHKIPFYVAAPSSTFDLSIADGSKIPIEQRAAEEITEGFGRRTAPSGVRVYNPAFDVTPARLIAAIITERGIIRRPNARKIREHLAASSPLRHDGHDVR